MGRTFSTWTYTSDDGLIFARKAAHDYVTQLDGGDPKIGGAGAIAGLPKMPRSFKPRCAVCEDSSHNRYRIVCYSPTAVLYTTVGTTFNIYDRDGGSAVAVTMVESEGERKRGYRVAGA